MLIFNDWGDLSVQASTSNDLNETAADDVDLIDVTDDVLCEDAAGFEQVCSALHQCCF